MIFGNESFDSFLFIIFKGVSASASACLWRPFFTFGGCLSFFGGLNPLVAFGGCTQGAVQLITSRKVKAYIRIGMKSINDVYAFLLQ